MRYQNDVTSTIYTAKGTSHIMASSIYPNIQVYSRSQFRPQQRYTSTGTLVVVLAAEQQGSVVKQLVTIIHLGYINYMIIRMIPTLSFIFVQWSVGPPEFRTASYRDQNVILK